MFGFSGPFGLEEAALRNTKDSLHHNGWREAFIVMFLVWAGGAVLFNIVDYSPVPSKLLFFAVFFAGFGLGLLLRWVVFARVQSKLAARKLEQETETRENRAGEQAKQIQAARAAGKFDRWR